MRAGSPKIGWVKIEVIKFDDEKEGTGSKSLEKFNLIEWL
jgi:hypothetical protein